MKKQTGKIPKTIMVNLNLAKSIDQEIWNMVLATQQGKDHHRINYPITESTAVKILLADRNIKQKDMKDHFPPYTNHNSRKSVCTQSSERRSGGSALNRVLP